MNDYEWKFWFERKAWYCSRFVLAWYCSRFVLLIHSILSIKLIVRTLKFIHKIQWIVSYVIQVVSLIVWFNFLSHSLSFLVIAYYTGDQLNLLLRLIIKLCSAVFVYLPSICDNFFRVTIIYIDSLHLIYWYVIHTLYTSAHLKMKIEL